MLDRFCLVLTILGALNWLTIALFGFDFIAIPLKNPFATRALYALIGVCGLWCVSLLFSDSEAEHE